MPDQKENPQPLQPPDNGGVSVAATLAALPNGRSTINADYFSAGTFAQDVAAYMGHANRKTGYANMDLIQPLYPGFYVLGAISSLGKTTLLHQMADQMAELGQPVLYFSLEQSRFELFSKSLARRFQMEAHKHGGNYPTPSSIDIRRGAAPEKELAQHIAAQLSLVGDRLTVIDGAFGLTVDDIVEDTEEYMKRTGTRPVVIVDYLQIIAPATVQQKDLRVKTLDNTKDNIDNSVRVLKAFQTAQDLTIIVISSLNRQNYMAPVDFESFKESGGIEYSADVVWGLQLAVMRDELFNKEGSISMKREKIREAKAAIPRKIELLYLKNRYGAVNYAPCFNYYPHGDLIVPDMTARSTYQATP